MKRRSLKFFSLSLMQAIFTDIFAVLFHHRKDSLERVDPSLTLLLTRF